MEESFLTICVIGVVVLFIIQLRNQNDIADLRRQLQFLRRDVMALKPDARAQPATAPATVPTAPSEPKPVPPETVASFRAAPSPDIAEPISRDQPGFHRNIERQFGGRAFVWIGGVALALAGFFLVKYSIETGILTEDVRVILGVVFGVALLAGSQAVRARKQIADGTRIAQALAGAGIADLYGSLFAATTLYHLIPSWLGFAAMAAVTATALVLSLRHGSPIAVLGLIGGYATPALIQGDPNTPLLFGYLYLVCAGLTGVARSREWWWLPAPALVVAYLWVLGWLLMGHGQTDALWLSLFLVAIAATAVVADRDAPPTEVDDPRYILRNLAPIASLVLMGAVTYSAQYGAFEWAMFATLSVTALLLAWFDSHTYRYVPWLAMGANLVMLAGWSGYIPSHLAIVLAGFVLLFGVGAQVLIRRSDRPVQWAALSAVASLCYFLLAYIKLNFDLVADLGKQTADLTWAAVAVVTAAAFSAAVTQIYVLNSEPHIRATLQTIYAAAATTLLSLALAIVLDQDYLPFAAAAEVFALSWIASRTEIAALRKIAVVLTGLHVLLLLPSLTALFIVEDAGLGLLHAAFRFGVPAVLFALASLNWREEADDRFVEVLEVGSMLLASAFCFRVLVILLIGHGSQYDLAIDSLQTILILGLAIASLRLSRHFVRPALRIAAAVLATMAVLRVVVLQLLINNPLWSHQWVGDQPLINVILIAYAAPAALLIILARGFTSASPLFLAAKIAAYVLGAVALTLLVRQIFQGAWLNFSGAGNAEVYAYSAAWLAAGVALLLTAVYRSDPTMRVVSLVVMLLTVGKVFLYDASQLTGLWRVVSFLGLGFSLLGLSWFYSRFVFSSSNPAGGNGQP